MSPPPNRNVAGYVTIAVILTAISTAAGLVLTNHASFEPINHSTNNTTGNFTANNNTNTNNTNATTEIITTNGAVNLSDIGNVTAVKLLPNGIYKLTVSSSKEHKYKDNVVQAIKKNAGQFANICTVQITTKDDNESRIVYEKPNSEACLYRQGPPPVINETPPTPAPEKPPIILVDSPIKCVIKLDCMLTSRITDSDSNITQVIWNQESGPPVNFTTSSDGWTTIFKPLMSGNYLFSVEAQDDKGHTALKTITVTVTLEPIPNPEPTPANNTDMKILITGDVGTNTDSMLVFKGIKAANPTNVFVLGDLGYQSNLAWFKSTYGTLGNKVNCVIGNHESANEDGSAAIQKEATDYCSDAFFMKKNHVLFIFFDSNGDLAKQATNAGKLLTNTNFTQGIKSVHIISHKPCGEAPNSHHPLEIKAFCDSVKSNIPTTIKAYYDSAHNHVMSESVNGTYKTVGAGGKSHYTCGTSAAFPFCDNAHFGYLQYDIKPDGTTTSSFKDYNGKVVSK